MLLLIAAAHKALAARPPKRRGVLGELKQVANGRAVHAFRLEPCRLKLSPPRNRTLGVRSGSFKSLSTPEIAPIDTISPTSK